MRPDKMTVYQLFERQQRYVVPLFQRPYVWARDDQWIPLWEDIETKATELSENDRDISSHFLGAAVIRKLDTYGRQVTAFEIIDGQQRLTTLQVLLIAFRDYLKSIAFEDYDRDLERLTTNTGLRADENEQYKVWPTTSDRIIFEAVFSAENPADLRKRVTEKKIGSSLLGDAYTFFFGKIKEYVIYGETEEEIESPAYDEQSEVAVSRIESLMEALRRHLEIVIIELERGDDPQIIFETLNARGVPLLASDLIRNFVFLEASGETPDEIQRLYNQYWLMFDDYEKGQAGFWKEKERQGRLIRQRIDVFMSYYLTSKIVQDIKITHVFQAFQRWWNRLRAETGVSVEDILKDIQRAAQIYVSLNMGEANSRLNVFVQRLKIMDVGTLYPVIVYLLNERADTEPAELDKIWTDLESYFVRRMICGLTTKAYNRTVMTILRDLRRSSTIDRAVVQGILAGFQGDTASWPSDEKIWTAWQTSPLYKKLSRARIQLILEAIDLELQSNKQEQFHIKHALTIEHIYPQNPAPEFWESLEDSTIIHTMGNLTLLTGALNSSVSNGAFINKRAEIAKQSRLRLNSAFQDLAGQTTWGVSDIASRAETLFEYAKKIWPAARTARDV